MRLSTNSESCATWRWLAINTPTAVASDILDTTLARLAASEDFADHYPECDRELLEVGVRYLIAKIEETLTDV